MCTRRRTAERSIRQLKHIQYYPPKRSRSVYEFMWQYKHIIAHKFTRVSRRRWNICTHESNAIPTSVRASTSHLQFHFSVRVQIELPNILHLLNVDSECERECLEEVESGGEMSKNCYLAILKRVGNGDSVSVIVLLLFAGNDYMISTLRNSFLAVAHSLVPRKKKTAKIFF